ncbi:MAG TPA: hypothetical protein QGI67_08725 [Acidimicrobiales bacterium]|nr:hypothetical protein [Acidimicrobiales bacterium]
MKLPLVATSAAVVVGAVVVVGSVTVVVGVVLDVPVVLGATDNLDGNAVSAVAPPHAARRPPATMIATNLFITTGFHSGMITLPGHL